MNLEKMKIWYIDGVKTKLKDDVVLLIDFTMVKVITTTIITQGIGNGWKLLN